VSVGNDGLLPEIPESLALLSHRRGDLAVLKSQALFQELQKTLLLEKERNLVDGIHVAHTNDLLVLYLAASGDLCNGSLVKLSLATAGNLVTVRKARRSEAQYIPHRE
jgi:hypothetical protein